MTCREVRSHLFAYIDRELDGPRRIAMQEHLKRCPECARDNELERGTLRKLSETIKFAAPRSGRSDDEIVSALRREMSEARPASFARRTALAACAAVVLLAATGVWWAMRTDPVVPAPRRLADLLAADFDHFVRDGAPVEFASADPRKVSAWLYDQLELDVRLPVNQSTTVRLRGARLCEVAGARVAIAAFEVNGTSANLVVLKVAELEAAGVRWPWAESGDPWVASSRGCTVVGRSDGERLYVAVSTLTYRELLSLVGGGAGKKYGG